MSGNGKSGGIPGPGQYSATIEVGRAPAYTFGLKTGSILDSKKAVGMPGPGQYNADASTLSSGGNHNRGGGFGTEKRSIGGVTKSMTEMPGPG
jgi:hypothetical protein